MRISRLNPSAIPQGYVVLLYNRDRTQRKNLPMNAVGEAAFTYDIRGGYADFSVPYNVDTLSNAIISAVEHGDCIEIWNDKKRFYRGFITDPTRTISEPVTLGFGGYGLSQQLSRFPVDIRYTFPPNTDASEAFRQLCYDLFHGKFPNLVIEAEPSGYFIDSLDGTQKTFGDVVGDILKISGDLCTWGTDAVGDRDADFIDATNPDMDKDRLYFRRIGTKEGQADFVVSVPGVATSAPSAEERSAELCNIAVVIGGPPRFPNRITNASFEYPQYLGENAPNFIENPSFTPRSGWGLDAGASYKAGGLSEGATYEGPDMVEIDHVGENFNQARDDVFASISPPTALKAGFHVRRENGASGGTAKFQFNLRAAGVDTSAPYEFFHSPDSAAWQAFDLDIPPSFIAGAGAYDGFKVRIEATVIDGSTGLLYDGFYLYDTSRRQQQNWQTSVTGSALVAAYNAAQRDSFDGGYCVLLQASGADSDNYIQLLPSTRGSIAVSTGETLRYGGHFKCGPSLMSPNAFLKIAFYNDSGRIISVDDVEIIVLLDGTYTLTDKVVTVPSFAVKADVFVQIENDNELVIDALFCIDNAVPTDTPYYRDGPIMFTIRAQDVCTVDTPEQLSESVYGPWPDYIQSDSITTYQFALSTALQIFPFRAVPLRYPTVTINQNDKNDYFPGKTVSLQGKQGSLIASSPVAIKRVQVTSGNIFSRLLQMDTPSKNIEQIVKDLAGKAIKQLGGGGLSSAAFSPGNSSYTVGVGTGLTAPDPEIDAAHTRDAVGRFAAHTWDTLKEHFGAVWAALDIFTADPTGNALKFLRANAAGDGVEFADVVTTSAFEVVSTLDTANAGNVGVGVILNRDDLDTSILADADIAHYFKTDESSSDIVDSVAGKVGSVSGAVDYLATFPIVNDKALRLHDSSAHIAVNDLLYTGAGDTYSCLIIPELMPSAGGIIFAIGSDAGASYTGFAVYCTLDLHIAFSNYGIDGTNLATYTPGTVYHICLTMDATKHWKLYVNGELIGGTLGTFTAPANHASIGFADYSGGTQSYNGVLAKFAHYSAVKTADEVKALSDEALNNLLFTYMNVPDTSGNYGWRRFLFAP